MRGLAAITITLIAATGSAQERGFRVHRYEPTSVGSQTVLIERPWYSSTRFFAVGVTGDYSWNALVPRIETGRGAVQPVLEHALLGHVDLAGSLFDRVRLSASLPIAFLERGTPELVSQVAPLAGLGVGDPRVAVMVRIAGQAETSPFSLHVGGDVWVPIGAQTIRQGDASMRLLPRVVMAGAFGVARWTADLGFLLRSYASLGPPALGMTAASEARGGLAFGLSLLDDRLTFGPEARWSMQVFGDDALTTRGMSVEVLGSANVLLFGHISLSVAGGTGFFGAAGTPDARAIARLAWAPRRDPSAADEAPRPPEREGCPPGTVRIDGGCADPNDADGDSISDSADVCPFEPETRNGLRDADGCPELDTSPALARVLTDAPQPTRGAETPTAFAPAGLDAGVRVASPTIAMAIDAGASGAPSTVSALVVLDGGAAQTVLAALPDSDADGVPDEADRCPVTPEDLDGFEDEDGCPELDNDDDGVTDAKDACAAEGETFNGVDDGDGCPDLAPDADRDGVADIADRCPFEVETLDGVRDDDGCPEFVSPGQAALSRFLTAPSDAPGAVTLAALTDAPERAPASRGPLDSDTDGVDDEADRCPVTSEDKDAFEDDDGCPEPDNDDDGVADLKDRCPEEAETFNGSRDDDGCPDELVDVDGDGVDYENDRCPLEAATTFDGCPHLPPPALAIALLTPPAPVVADAGVAEVPVVATEADFDRDGVLDDHDRCPVSAEDKDEFEDEDGCAEPDNDHDGVDDAKDKCPLEAETINGKKDEDGCPDVGVGVVTIQANAVVIDGVIRFKTASATLLPASLPLLKQVAATLRSAATLSVEIQGHTDDKGSAAANIRLSKKRAEAIRAVLVKNGVSTGRLVAVGYGPKKPRASNKTEKGREQNRRVEFLILGEAK